MMNSSYFDENKVSNLIIKLKEYFLSFDDSGKLIRTLEFNSLQSKLTFPETFRNRSIHIGNLVFLKVTLHHGK